MVDASGSNGGRLRPTPVAYLRAVSGPAAGLTLQIGDELLLGRTAPGLERLADDAELSRRHASLLRGEDGLVIEDLGSRNGTTVNGVRVERQPLVAGDRIRVGATTFELMQGALRSDLYDDEVIRPWYEHAVRELAAGATLLDIHGHTGFNDPDGFTFSGDQLIATLAAAEARGVVMPMHEPDGYPAANDRVLAESEASGGRFVAFCRLDPKRDAVAEARRCVEAGARGIKLHPRAEEFQLSDPEIEPIIAFAHERRLPVLVHAGRGIPTLAKDAVQLAGRFSDARIILAHAAICDLNWIWRVAPQHRNLFIDTAWWNPNDLAALFAHIPPGQLLFGSDLPYFTPFMSATMAVRFGLQAGLSPEQLNGVLGAQATRLLDGDEPLDLGPAPGPERFAYSLLLERLTSLLVVAVGRMVMGRTGYEPLALARLACNVGADDAPEADVTRSVLALLEGQERFAREHPGDGPPLAPGIRSIMLAACVSRTPDVPLPALPDFAHGEHLRAEEEAGHRSFEATRLHRVPLVLQPDLRHSSAADHLMVDGEDY
ncbi:MAG TPA: amidohydrolase family protein [Gaiellaceae bacterium]|nr:amidohydrolase family protein [Gaiellaceae bacterium]